MKVYRITLRKWSKSLKGSGYPGRWNSKGVFVIYTSNSIALASLENLVHRSGEGLNHLFAIMEIEIPSQLKIKEVFPKDLSKNWYKYENYSKCQEVGDKWINEGNIPILKVPSSIIRLEHNYLINTNHIQFKKIKIKSIENFEFDPRLKR